MVSTRVCFLCFTLLRLLPNWKCHQSTITTTPCWIIHCPKSQALCTFSTHVQPFPTIDLFPVSVFPFAECKIARIKYYMVFFKLSFFYVAMYRFWAWEHISLYCWIIIPLNKCATIYSPIERQLDCFHFRSIMNKTAINIHMQFLLWT